MKKTAVLFPGQGSQSVGMLSALADIEIVRHTFAEAASVLHYDLWALAQEGPEEKLNQTKYTQPVLLATSIALWRYWQTQQNLKPAFLAGHSLGEYTALVVAEVLTFSDALKLVSNRGIYMQEAVPPGVGAMAAIVGLDNQKIIELCKQSREGREVLSPANFNSIGQTVIAGHSLAVDRAIILAEQAGAKIAKRIPVSIPSHCALMELAVRSLERDLLHTDIFPPKIPVLHNYDVMPHLEPAAIREALLQQLTHPVRWVETIQWMEKNGVEIMLECGPGKVLAGLNKRITQNIPTYSTVDSSLLRRTCASS